MKEKGYSLIELLTAMSIFVIVSSLLVGLFLTSLQIQRRTFVNRDLQDNARFVLDLLSKEIRTADPFNFNLSGGVLSFINDRDQPVTYGLGGSSILRNSLPLTSISVAVEKFDIILEGEGSNDDQPRITIVLKMISNNNPTLPPLEVQTTISVREYDTNN